jgi:hypothetical protein
MVARMGKEPNPGKSGTRGSRDWLLALISLDLLVLPMFHIGSIPFKAAYLVPLWYFPRILQTRFHRKYNIPLLLLALLVWVGLLTFWFYFQFQFNRQLALTYSVGLALCAGGFSFGFTRFRARLDFLLALNLFYTAINIYLWIFFEEAEGLVQFFNLSEPIKLGVMLGRNTGIMYNSNVSAMGTILMMVVWAVALEKGRLGYQSLFWIALMLGMSWLAIFSFLSRGSIIMLGLLTGYFLLRNISFTRVIKIGMLVIMLFVGLYGLYESNETFAQRFDRTIHSLPMLLQMMVDFDNQPRVNTILRPVRDIEVALGRFIYSPLWGSSLERIEGEEPVFASSGYHSDFFSILVCQGGIGILAYLFLLNRAYRVCWILLLPYLNGLVNSFVLLPSHYLFFSIMLGYFYGNMYYSASCYATKRERPTPE